jgi:hypothetical protein
MRATVIQNLKARFQSYADLISEVDRAALKQRLDAPKHKSLGEHLWCVVGARESYARAIEAGEWSGFSCSMKSFGHGDFAAKLDDSARAVLEAVENVTEWSDGHDELLMMLAEHEVMHEGQIIRHMYGLEKTLPGSWKWA